MMILKYALKQLKKRPFMTILILFQFAAITILISMIISKMQGYFVTSNLVKKVCTKNSYKVNYDVNYSVEIDDRTYELIDEMNKELEPYEKKMDNGEITEEEYYKMQRKLNKKYDKIMEDEGLYECDKPIDTSDLPYVQKNYIDYSSNIIINEDNKTNADVISSDLCDDLDFKMKEGCWLTDAKQTDGYINIVGFTGGNYNVGDVVDIYIYKENKTHDIYNVKTSLKGRIVGLIDYSYYKKTLEKSSGGYTDFVGFDDFLSASDSDFVFIEYTNILSKNKDMWFEPFYTSVKLKDNITDTERKEFFAKATEKKYQCDTLYKAYENSYSRDMKKFKNDLIFLVIASLIAIISLIGMSALSVSKEIKTYSIFCLNGMTRKQCIGINAVYVCILVFISTIIAFLIKLGYSYIEYQKYLESSSDRIAKIGEAAKESFSKYFSVDSAQIMAVIILFCIACLSAMVIPYITLKKLNIIQNIKEKR